MHFGNFFLGLGPRLTQRVFTRAESGDPLTPLVYPRTAFLFVTTFGGWL